MADPSPRSHRTSVPLRVVTYNVHRCRGLDRRTRPDRIAAVLSAIDADIIALQEVIGPGPSPGHAAEVGAALGFGWVMGPARVFRRHVYGNVILSRFPMRDHSQHDLSWKTCEPRSAQRVAVDIGGPAPVHVFNVHLGTALLERRYQAGRLAAWVHDRRVAGPKLVVGDFNEWSGGLATSVLTRRLKSFNLFEHSRRRGTYPGVFPILHLDHIYFEGDVDVVRVRVPRTRQAMVASDHLPLVADVRVRF